MPKLSGFRPFGVGALCYLVLVTLMIFLVGFGTRFEQFYCLDDAYIHLAVAKNLFLHHSFGVTPHVFSAVSSSLIWPFLVALGFGIFGIHAILPLVMEILFSLVLLYLCQRFFIALQPQAPVWMQVILQLSIVLSTSLIMLTFGGMEHILQTLADLLFVYLLAQTLDSKRASAVPFALSAALVTGVRYEGLFLVFVSCLVLLFLGRFLVSIATGVAALLPPAAMGFYSVGHGSHFLPNSLMIKAVNPGQVRFYPALFGPPFQGILSHYSLKQGLGELFLVAGGLLCLSILLRGLLSLRTRYLLVVYCGTCLLHAQFSRLGWVYRYEAYLIALGIFLLLNAAVELYVGFEHFTLTTRRWALVSAAMLVLASVTLLNRDFTNLREIPGGAQAIYDQQYQMGRFLAAYYPDAPIAANDIGAIAFLGNHEVLDLAGLASVEVTNLKAANQLTTANIRRLAEQRHTRVAVAYPSWFLGVGQLPPEWVPVGAWSLAPRYRGFLGGDLVTFYAIRPEEAEPLAHNLRAFSSQLPANITQSGLYLRYGPQFAALRLSEPRSAPRF